MGIFTQKDELERLEQRSANLHRRQWVRLAEISEGERIGFAETLRQIVDLGLETYDARVKARGKR